MRFRHGVTFIAVLVALFGAPAMAQHGQDPQPAPLSTSPSGANPTAEAVNEQQLLRHLGKLEGRITIPDYKAAILQQPQGRSYQTFHERILPWASGIIILAMIAGLAVFYIVRGPIRMQARATGIRILRFTAFERLLHWMTATAFVVLALTGLNFIFGKRLLFPLIGPDAFSAWSQWAKFAHDTMAWVFVLGVVLMLALWTRDNLLRRYDLRWLREFGGITSGRHPPAGRFNAGQKLIYWSVVAFGVALAVTGIIMFFPFWALDINGMQVAQYVHASVGTLLIAVIIAHIYIGTLGMEGAFEGMRSGDVDLAWARENHRLWVEEQETAGRTRPPAAAGVPAE